MGALVNLFGHNRGRKMSQRRTPHYMGLVQLANCCILVADPSVLPSLDPPSSFQDQQQHLLALQPCLYLRHSFPVELVL